MRGAQMIAMWKPFGGGPSVALMLEIFAEQMTRAAMVSAPSNRALGPRALETRRSPHQRVAQIWARNPVTDTGSNPASLANFSLVA